MRKRKRKSSSGKKNRLLYPLVGFILLMAVLFALRPVRRVSPHHPPRPRQVQAPSAPAARPFPAPVPPPAAAPLFPQGKGKIAIVLDDWGYTLRQLPALTSIHRPLTVSVLPGLAHSVEVARAARANGDEVILHMPMEALDPKAPREAERILVGMSRPEVAALLDRSLRTVPGACGISNHQGSKATSDVPLMGIVLKEIKRRGLYFLDSYVTSHSVCDEVARRVQIPFARRAVFLDNEQSTPAIRRQLAELARAAARRGSAIGIGHDRPVMLDVLKKAVPELEKAGYTLVPVSKLTEVERPRSRD